MQTALFHYIFKEEETEMCRIAAMKVSRKDPISGIPEVLSQTFNASQSWRTLVITPGVFNWRKSFVPSLSPVYSSFNGAQQLGQRGSDYICDPAASHHT